MILSTKIVNQSKPVLLLLLFPSIDATDKESTIIKISASDNNIQTNTVEVYASLRNSNGQPVSNQLLIFYVNNQIFASNITNDNGDSSIQFQALEEVYEIQVRFDGSESYKESESEIIIVQKIDENNFDEKAKADFLKGAKIAYEMIILLVTIIG